MIFSQQIDNFLIVDFSKTNIYIYIYMSVMHIGYIYIYIYIYIGFRKKNNKKIYYY